MPYRDPAGWHRHETRRAGTTGAGVASFRRRTAAMMDVSDVVGARGLSV